VPALLAAAAVYDGQPDVAPAALARVSDAVVVVGVIGAASWLQDDALANCIAVDVVDVVAGAPLASTTLVVRGGRMGARREVVAEVATLWVGTRVVVFLGHDDHGDAFVMGGSLGVWPFSTVAAARALFEDERACVPPPVGRASSARRACSRAATSTARAGAQTPWRRRSSSTPRSSSTSAAASRRWRR